MSATFCGKTYCFLKTIREINYELLHLTQSATAIKKIIEIGTIVQIIIMESELKEVSSFLSSLSYLGTLE